MVEKYYTRAMLAKEETSRIRSPQVELIRELTAVKKKVRSLQDPSTTVFSFDTLSLHTRATRLSWKENTAWALSSGDELFQPLVAKKKKKTRRIKNRGGAVEVGNGHWRLRTPGSEPRWPAAARIKHDAYVNSVAMDIGKHHRKDGATIKKCIGVDGDGRARDEPCSAHKWNEEKLETGEKAQKIGNENGTRGGRINNRNASYSPQCGHRATKEGSNRLAEGRQGENARKPLMSETPTTPGPYPHHGLVSNLTRGAPTRTSRGTQDQGLEGEKDKEAKKWDSVEQESVEESSSSRMWCNDTTEESLFDRRDTVVKPREVTPLTSSEKREEGVSLKEGSNLKACSVDVRGETKSEGSDHSSSYAETRIAPTNATTPSMTDEPEEVSNVPRRKRRGLLPWSYYWSRLRKYKSKKRLFAFVRRSFACVCAVPVKSKREKKVLQAAAATKNPSRLTTTTSNIGGCEVPPAAPNKPAQLTRKTLQSYFDGVQRVVGDSESGEISRSRNHDATSLMMSLSERSIPTCEPPPEFRCNPARSRGGGGGGAGAGRGDLGEDENRRAASSSGREGTNDRASSPEVQEFVSATDKMHCKLSQKYRPKTFKDLVGQTLVVRSLVNAITKGKVVPVYLFTGPHGTGKTSAARIFAAALVCLAVEPHCRPCGLCKECATSFRLHRSFNVREVDAANDVEMEHLRALLGAMSLSSSLSHSGYQVFIIEHCEFLSTETWNTFLKFLEEPPPDVVLILIAADPESLPLTAISRCQRFVFGKLKDAEIVSRLQMLAAKETLEVDVAALSLIASRADGSLRDAESILDQLSILDKKVSLAIVQELVGLVPDDMLLDLLDLALSVDTKNIVRCTRKLLDLGVDALSLVAQLASLITKILGGSFDMNRETCTNGFFRRDLSSREEQRQLRRALKVLLESQKHLHASHDQTTWVTAALLQFAPDQSYIPSSVDTSMAPSPVAFDTSETLSSRDPYTPRLLNFRDTEEKQQHQAHYLQHHQLPPWMSHMAREEEERPQSFTHLESRMQHVLSVIAESDAKVHPAPSPLRKLGDNNSSSDEIAQSSSSLRSHNLFARSGDFQLLSHRDLEDVWTKVVHSYRSNVLRQLMHDQAMLVSLAVAKDTRNAIAHVEFQHPEHKARAERLQSSTCQAFQMALGCPVELKFSLASMQKTVLEDSKELPLRQDALADSHPNPLLSSSSEQSKLKAQISKAPVRSKGPSKLSEVVDSPLHLNHRCSKSPLQVEGSTGQPPMNPGNLKVGCQMWQHSTGLIEPNRMQSQTFNVNKPSKLKGASCIEQDKLRLESHLKSFQDPLCLKSSKLGKQLKT